MSSNRRSNQSTSTATSPRFVQNLHDIYVTEGETSALECRVVGFPRPEIQWERNGKMVPKSRNIQLERIGDRCLLRIKSCESKDKGHYSCIARNIMGTATSRGTLHVLSGFKVRITPYNGTKSAPSSEKENSSRKQATTLITNSRYTTKLKSPHSMESKLDLTRAMKSDHRAGKDVKATVLVKKNVILKSKNTDSNRLTSVEKEKRLTPGNFSRNHMRELPRQLITQSVNKRNQDTAPLDTLKTPCALRTRHFAQAKFPSKQKSDNAYRNDQCCDLAKSLKHNLKRSLTLKKEPKIIDEGARGTIIENRNEDLLKVKNSIGKKEAIKNKLILRNEKVTSDEKSGTQLKLGAYHKSVVLPNVPKGAVKLVRQRKLEAENSLEQSTEVRNFASSACGNRTKALKVSDVSKTTFIKNDSPTVSTNTSDSCEGKMSDSGFKINSSRKKEAENILGKNRNGKSDFRSVQNANCNLNPPNRLGLGKPKVSNRSITQKKSNFTSNFRIDCRESSKLKSANLNKMNFIDPRINIKVNHTIANNLGVSKGSSKFGKNYQQNSTSHGFLEKKISSFDNAVGLGSVKEKSASDLQNGKEHSEDVTHDCNLCPCIHKALDRKLNNDKEGDNSKSKIKTHVVRCKSEMPPYVNLANDTSEKFVVSTATFYETQNCGSTDTNDCSWKQNNEYKIPSSAVDDTKNFSKSRPLPFVELNSQADLNNLSYDVVKLSKDEKNVEIRDISQTQRRDDKILWNVKVPNASKAPLREYITSASGPVYSHDVFPEEIFRPRDKADELPKKEIREREENDTLAVTSGSNITNQTKEDKRSIITETKTSGGYIQQNDVKVVNHAKAHGRKEREVLNTRTCRGNVRLNSDVIEEECEYFIPKIPEVEAEEDKQQVESQEEFPVRIVKGPQSVTVLRGESVTLAVHFQGTPQATVNWARGGTTLRSDGRVSILVGRDMSVLTVSDVTADDSGKYVVTVENSGGGDSCFASMAVVGIPEPPGGQPTARDVTDHSLVLSWYGSMYDGGSVVTGYVIEMCTLPERRWHRVSSCVNTSHVIQGLSNGQHYVFRVRAENRYGLSQPSRESEAICLEDSNSCEDWEVSRSPVKVEAGSMFSEQFELKEEVGKGRFGTVYRCIERISGRPRAAKVIRCIKAKDKETVEREISVMNKLHHPKLMQILAAFESGKNMIMVMEFISGGELFERVIADDFVLTEHDCVLFMRQICDGVAYMHKCCVLHLDLKPENILCKTRTCHQIKIIDFGLARVYSLDESLRVLFGTPEFVAPEVINYEPVGPPSDMWSVGVICYVLLSGLSPFMGESDPETFANITRGEMDFDDEAFDTISEDAKNFISLLLVKKRKNRMTAEECLKHCWLANPRWNASEIPLSTEKLKRFIIRRKWQKTGTAIRALGRMVSLSRSSLGSSGGTPSPLGSPKIFRSQSEISRSETSESGFSEIFSDTNSISELIS